MTISFIRSIILYAIVIICVRAMGKRQISQLQTSELVVTLLISDIAAIPMQNSEQPLFSGLIPILVLVACEIMVSAFMMKSEKFRKLICGKPIVIINDGVLDQKQMKRLRMSTQDLSEQIRQLDIASINDIAYAIVETNGKLSIIKKAAKQNPDNTTLGITVPKETIETVVISDGEISNFSLALCSLTKEWIYEVLSKEGLLLKDIFIMTANKDKKFNIIKKEKN